MKVSPPVSDAKEKISALIATLHATGKSLEELTIGEVDTVADHEGQTFVLRHAQEQLRHIEAAKQAAILNALPAHIALLNTLGVIISVNGAWLRFSGRNTILAPGYAIGLNYLEICDGARGSDSFEAHQVAEGIRSVLGGGIDSFSIEYRCETQTGEHWFALTVTPLAGDHPSGAVVMHVDVTERRQSEEGLRRHQSELRALFDLVPAMIWFKDTNNGILRVNKLAAEAAGLSVEEIEGRPSSDIYPHDAVKFYAADLEVIDSKLSKLGIIETVLDQENNEHWVQTDKVPYFDDNGKVIGIVVMAQDITARKQAETELARRADELMRSNADLEQFANAASHDLQEPLRTIHSYTQLLIRELKGNPLADEYAIFIVGAVKRMKEMIEGVLAYSNVSHQKPSIETIDLKKAYLDAIASLDAVIKESSAVVTCGPLPSLPVDAYLFHTLFQNLIANALKFRGAAAPVIDINCQRIGSEWVFSVQDNGIGIPPEHKDRIFGIFQRLHTRDQYPGSGLGLSMCKRIVERHGGRIWVEPSPHGSRLVFTIPAGQMLAA